MNTTRLRTPNKTKQQSAIDVLIIAISAAICILMLPTRWPGMELLGVGPSWLVMWLVAWTLHRSIGSSLIAATILGLIQDGMTGGQLNLYGLTLSHVISLIVVVLTVDRLHKRQYVTSSVFGAVVLAFGMTILSEIILCGQHLLDLANFQFTGSEAISIDTIWQDRSRSILISALVSSIWMPLLYYPLSRRWQHK
jgi:rod shape-determining protein MreD